MDYDIFVNKPNISASSRKLYTFNLTKLNGGKPITNLKFLGNDDILGKIEALKPNTRRTYLISIVSALKDRPEAKYKKLFVKYYSILEQLNKELKNNTEKTPRVKENWLDQADINKKLEELQTILPEIQGKKKLTTDEYNRLLNLVILSIYTLQQPRRNRDYTEMMISKSNPEDTSHNWINIADWEWIFNNYKTAKKYTQQILPINDELKSILQVYLKYHPRAKDFKKKKPTELVQFLVHHDGSVISTSTEMTRLLNKIFGKKIGCSMLRAIYLTDKYGKQSAELQADATAMGTSVDTAQNNYIKKED
jgi:hypothetical protein